MIAKSDYSELLRECETHLNLILLPTEKCNLRCTYCYERFELGKMAPDVVKGVKRLISKRQRKLKSLHISWFGGEPLLAPDVIEDISLHAQASNISTFTGSMSTNGVLLTPNVVETLERSNVAWLQISLDGFEKDHDVTRCGISGQKTFKRIISNLSSFSKSNADIHICLRIHVTKATVQRLPEFGSYLIRKFAPDYRFSAFVKPVAKLGSDTDKKMLSLNEHDYTIISQEQRRLAVHFSSVPAQSKHLCYAAMPNSFAIRSNGQIVKCTVGLDDDYNQVGKITSDGLLELDQEKCNFWFRGFKNNNVDELRCPRKS